MKVAMLGLDSAYWPHAFARELPLVPGAGLVGFTDLGVPEGEVRANIGMSAAEYSAQYKLRRFETIDEAFEGCDAVLVSTRNTKMPDVIVQALGRGKHVFAAKPVGVRKEDLERIGRAIREGVVFSAGQSARNHPAVSKALEWVRSGEIGELHTLRLLHQHGRMRALAAGNWYSEPTEGNACHWLGWYTLDMAVAFAGPIKEIVGFAEQRANSFADQPDHCKAIAQHANGLLSSMDIYCDIDPDWGVGFVEFEVVGTKGVIRHIGTQRHVLLSNERGSTRHDCDGPDVILRRDLSEWIRACHGEGKVALGGREALHIAAAGCAWDDAARSAGHTAKVLSLL